MLSDNLWAAGLVEGIQVEMPCISQTTIFLWPLFYCTGSIGLVEVRFYNFA